MAQIADEKWRALVLIAVAQLLVLTLWFSGTAVVPELTVMWNLSATEEAWLTNAVQLGFVVGALGSAILTIADVIPPKYLFSGSALIGAAATALIAGVVDSGLPAIALRFVTGVMLAGVYPIGMKMMAAWFTEGRGLAIGVLVGALTVGSAMPHLIRGVGGIGDPNFVLYVTAALAAIGGVMILLYEDGPHTPETAPFDPGAIKRIMTDRGVVLANMGYFGHMWELYAVWTWIPLYLAASFRASGTANAEAVAAYLAFGTIAIGGIGAWLGGSASDRWGRTNVTSLSMIISGGAIIGAGFVFGSSLWIVAPFVLIWGIFVIADSAQFSTAVSELAEESYVGTALTLQTSIGFLLTIGSIQLIPFVAEIVTWQWAFLPLVIGPAIGTMSMLYLKSLPEANKLAGGAG